jgi:hypothetical protein
MDSAAVRQGVYVVKVITFMQFCVYISALWSSWFSLGGIFQTKFLIKNLYIGLEFLKVMS